MSKKDFTKQAERIAYLPVQEEQKEHNTPSTPNTPNVLITHNTLNALDTQNTPEVLSTPKTQKAPRINLAFNDNNLEYLQEICRIKGVSMTRYINQLIQVDKETNQSLIKEFKRLLNK